MESSLKHSMSTFDPYLNMKYIRTSTTKIAINMYGFTMATVIATDIPLKTPYVTKTTIGGISKSITLKSFEKRVIILPIGLESKNYILALRTFSVILLCMLVDEVRIVPTIKPARI
jgi:hypothetical protein